MSDETLDEARREYARRVRLGGPISINVVDALVREERADAERAQRERAELAENNMVWERTRADGLARQCDMLAGVVREEATRPYRMVLKDLLSWMEADHPGPAGAYRESIAKARELVANEK